MSRGRVLILWNQLDDDVVEMWRRDGRRAPDWDPNLLVEPWDTVAEEIDQIVIKRDFQSAARVIFER